MPNKPQEPEDRIKVRGELLLFDMTEADAQLIALGKIPFKDFEPKGKKLVHDRNVITDDGDERIAELVGGLSTDFVRKMGIGDGGTSPGDVTVPLAPTKADTVLGHELVRHDPISSVSIITSPDFQIEFIETFLTTDPGLAPFLGASVINEMGLYGIDDILFARKTHVPVPFAVIDRVGVIGKWLIHVL